MTLGSLGTRLGRAWGIGAFGFVAAAYGCGSSTSNDQNEPPLRGTAGHGAGAAGRSTAGAPASGGATAGKSGSGGSGASGGSAAKGGRAGGAGDSGKAGAVGNAGTAAGGKGGGAGTTNGGGSPLGGEAGMSGGTGGEGGTPACKPDDLSIPFEARCLACATNACGSCLCGGCQQELQTCQSTSGCEAIAQCVLDSGCTSIDCYCGTHALGECLAGQSDGPCKDVILSAPGGHEPSLQDLSAGPAADAALAVGSCATSGTCAATCQ